MRTFRVTSAFRHWRLGHLVIEPGDYSEDQLTRLYSGLPDDLIRKERGHWLEAEPVQSDYPDPAQQETGDIPPVEPDEPLDFDAMSRDELDAYVESIGFDLSTVKGTGSNGNITKPDLVKALKALG